MSAKLFELLSAKLPIPFTNSRKQITVERSRPANELPGLLSAFCID